MKKNEFNLLTYRPAKVSKSADMLLLKSKINWSLILKGTFVGSFGLVMIWLSMRENLFLPEILLSMTIVVMLLIFRTTCRQSFSELKKKN